jgi:ABC-type dipeptide/oligopeptide/nickel transport system permease component
VGQHILTHPCGYSLAGKGIGMGRYIIKRLLQGIPLLLFISIILFGLMMNMGDPVATMGGRRVTRAADYERLRQIGRAHV